jgi:hypothetical protein
MKPWSQQTPVYFFFCTLFPVPPRILFLLLALPSCCTLLLPCLQRKRCFALLCVALRSFLPQCTHTQRTKTQDNPRQHLSFCFVFSRVFWWVVSIQNT